MSTDVLEETVIDPLGVEPHRQPQGDWPAIASVGVSVLVPVKNEQANIVECLRTLSFAKEIVVVDSASTDRTVELAEAMGATVVQFRYSKEGWPKKKNWALENVPWKHDWVLILDADERLVAPLAREIEDVINDRYNPPGGQRGDGDGYYLNRRFIFMGRWIRHCGYYPSYNLRLFRHRLGRYERIGNLGDTGSGDNEVHEHVVLRNRSKAGFLKHDFLHLAYPNLQTWIEKHNRYSNWEAYAMRAGMAGELHASLTRGSTERRRWIKRKVRHMPFRPTLRFLYSYVLQFGFLDGYAGYVLSRLMSWYEFVSLAKRHEIELAERMEQEQAASGTRSREYAAAQAQGPTITTTPPSPAVTDMPVLIPPVGSDGRRRPAPAIARAPAAASSRADDAQQMQPEASPWTFREKVGRAIWMLVGRPIFRMSFHNWYGFRAWLLRLFGANVGQNVAIRPTVNIEIPWMIEVHDGATIGDHAILYSLGKITVGKRSIISQYAHLCAGTHDYTDHTFKLIRPPITVGDDCWIGADAFIGPGVDVGHLSVIGARSSVYKPIGERRVFVGNPAKPIKSRELR